MPDNPNPDAEVPEIPELPEDVSSLDEAAIRSLHSDFQAAYDARRPNARSEGAVAELTGIRDAQKQLAGALRGQRQAARTLEDADTDAEASLPEPTDPAPEPDAPAATEPAPDAPAADAPDEPAPDAPAADAPDPDAAPAPDAAPVLADAAVAGADLDSKEGTVAPPNAVPAHRTPLRAAAGQQVIPAGRELTMAELARSANDTISSVRPGPDGRPVKAYIASLPAYEDEDFGNMELLGRGSPEHNTELMQAAVAAFMARLDPKYGGTPNAATAAICDPLDIIRQIPDCVTAAEPFSDSLPGRPAGRLGYQFMPSASLADAAAGVTLWDEADQSNVDPDDPSTWKPCVFIECPDIEDVRAEAVSACVYFDITTEMSSPERVEDIMRKVAAVKARTKEQRLMQIAATFSHHYSFTPTYGSVPGSIEAVLTTLEQGWSTERLDDATLYQWYVPKELRSAWVIDLVGRAFDANDVADATAYIEDKFRAAGKNVRIIELLDASSFPALPAVGGSAQVLAEGIRSAAYETLLLPPEGMLYFTTGEITTGVERSPELMRRNQSQWFMEEFMGLAKHGCQPWYALDLDVCESGTRAALTEPFDCTGLAT